MEGSNVKAPIQELTILSAISSPKYCKGTISEKTKIINMKKNLKNLD